MGYGLAGAFRKVVAVIAVSFWACVAHAEQVTIAALGDSLTQGYGLAQQDGFVPQLQSWLGENGAEVALINAGVSGDTTAGGASRVDWTLTPEVQGMIVTLGGNDVLRGLDPDLSRQNLDQILAAAAKADVPVLLVGMQAPGNYGPDYKEKFDAIYPELAKKYGTLYEASFFTGIAGDGEDLSQVRAFMQADGIHPNPEGVARIVEAIGPRVLELVARIEQAD